MKKLFAFLLLLVLTGAIPISCNLVCWSSCCGDDLKVQDFNIVTLAIETTDISNNAVDTAVFHTFDQVVKAISIEEKEFVSHLRQPTVSGSMFVNTAFACSPREPIALQKITSISVVSLVNTHYHSESDVIAVGEDISDRFVIRHMYGNDAQSFEDFIVSQFAMTGYSPLQMSLLDQPFQDTILKFNIRVELSDGKVFDFENQILKVRL